MYRETWEENRKLIFWKSGYFLLIISTIPIEAIMQVVREKFGALEVNYSILDILSQNFVVSNF